ncbi:hypothetical protein C8R46DRAFT_1361193 [Mycena filopes]|nr:hypothetical protein C8R46DRAFT_1361193 [Mycena filopes]
MSSTLASSTHDRRRIYLLRCQELNRDHKLTEGQRFSLLSPLTIINQSSLLSPRFTLRPAQMHADDQSRSSEDEELLKIHLAKNAIVFDETQGLLQGLDAELAELDTGTQDLECRISTIRELVRIRGLCNQVALKLQGVEQRLAPFQEQLHIASAKKKGLMEQHKKLARTASALQPPLTLERFREAPIRRLPSDVLAEIIGSSSDGRIQPLGRGLPPLVSRVCRWWRAVALDHPTFWASFSLSLNETRSARWLGLYLERSKTLPLTIDLNTTVWPLEWAVESYVNGLIAAHAERLESFTLRGTRWHSLDTKGIPTSQIRTLCLHLDNTYFDLRGFSNLTSLSWSFTFGLWGRRGWRTDLTVALPKLSTLQVDFSGAGPQTTTAVIHSPENTNFLHHFTTPALKSLAITSLDGPGGLTAFIKRSGCKLDHLRLEQASMRVSDLLLTLQVLSSLGSFEVVDGFATSFTNRVLEAMTMLPGRPGVLPELKRLRVDGRYAFSDMALVEMLESRTTMGDKHVTGGLAMRTGSSSISNSFSQEKQRGTESTHAKRSPLL